MGVPSFFRWLVKRFPMVVSNCIEDPNDSDPSNPNPNTLGDREFDALYLDMNGIIHPCFHPEGSSPPKSEEEVFKAVDLYIIRLFNIIRPRLLLYLAIDGVAPRAKMNQQRARRYRAAKEAAYNRIFHMAEAKLHQDKETYSQLEAKNFLADHDSNVITPGSPFFQRLTAHLQDFIQTQQSKEPSWREIYIFLSDSSVPGEGEHKILDFIRSQRIQKGYDPNRRHVIYGLDADLIFLGLISHEVYISILRENVIDAKSKNEFKVIGPDWFHFCNIFVFRQYLREVILPNSELNLERCIDDFIFLCFTAGNDFLPALPGFDIRTNAIDRISQIYKSCLSKSKYNITMNGGLDCRSFFKLVSELSDQRSEQIGLSSILYPSKLSIQTETEVNAITNTPDKVIADIDDMIKVIENKSKDRPPSKSSSTVLTTKNLKEIYYKTKFNISIDKATNVAAEYVRGMVWALRYYLRGVQSWDWFYPYHDPPCISDFSQVSKVETKFDLGEPFPPLYQLMAVLPPQSAHCLPAPYANLMTNENSPLIQYYPKTFKVDLHGGTASYKGSVHVPFINANELKKQLQKSSLTDEEKKRNLFGSNLVFVHASLLKQLQHQRSGNIFTLNGPIYGKMQNKTNSLGSDSKVFIYSRPEYSENTDFSYILSGAILPDDVLEYGKRHVRTGDKYQNDAFDPEEEELLLERPLTIPGFTPGATPESRAKLYQKLKVQNRLTKK